MICVNISARHISETLYSDIVFCVLHSGLLYLQTNRLVSEVLVSAVNAESKQVAQCREDLHKSQMKFLDEGIRRAREEVSRLANITRLEKEIEEQQIRNQQKLQQLRSHTATFKRLVW